MLADTDRRNGDAARRDRDIDPQPITLICDPAVAVIVIDLAALANDQQSTVRVVGPFRVEADRDGQPLAMALDGEFSRTCPINIGHIRIVDIFLQGAIAKQEIHGLLSKLGRIVPGSQAFLVGGFLDQILQDGPFDFACSNLGDQSGLRSQDPGRYLGDQIGQSRRIEIRVRRIIEQDGPGAIGTVLFGEQGVRGDDWHACLPFWPSRRGGR